MDDSTITFVVLGVIVVLFVTNRIPVAVIAVGTSLALWATGVLDLDQATAGFGDPTVLFIAALFVVSEALDATGVTAWIGQQLIDRAGTEVPSASHQYLGEARSRSLRRLLAVSRTPVCGRPRTARP